MTDQEINFDLAAAQWRRDITDQKAFIEGLATRLEHSLPGMVTINRWFKLFSKQHPVRQISVKFKDAEYLLNFAKNNGIQALIGKLSGGIRLSSQEVSFDDWLHKLSKAIEAHAKQHGSSREAIEKFLFS